MEKYGGKRETNRIICYSFFFFCEVSSLPVVALPHTTRVRDRELNECSATAFTRSFVKPTRAPSASFPLPLHRRSPSPASRHRRARVRLQLQPVTCSTAGTHTVRKDAAGAISSAGLDEMPDRPGPTWHGRGASWRRAHATAVMPDRPHMPTWHGSLI